MPTIVFVNRDGQRRAVDAPVGLTVLEVARKYDIEIPGTCGGALSCGTCHVIVAAEQFAKVGAPQEDEDEVLDLTFGITPTSRLGCQIVISEALDGLVLTLPPHFGGMV
ncbi:MAG: 2Fe-2S iron-sulfur cluster-binding protein [Alphaproteobacteria bacterium]